MIYFMRHGLDDESYVGGWSDISLTKEGKKQVKEIAQTLSELSIQRIVCSDIKRARETARIVNETLHVKIKYDPNLRELNKGKLSGMKKELAQILYPEYMDVVFLEQSYPDGESMLSFYRRIREYLKKEPFLDQTLYITHRGVINSIYYLFQEKKIDMNKEQFGVEHASVHAVDIEKKMIKRVR